MHRQDPSAVRQSSGSVQPASGPVNSMYSPSTPPTLMVVGSVTSKPGALARAAARSSTDGPTGESVDSTHAAWIAVGRLDDPGKPRKLPVATSAPDSIIERGRRGSEVPAQPSGIGEGDPDWEGCLGDVRAGGETPGSQDRGRCRRTEGCGLGRGRTRTHASDARRRSFRQQGDHEHDNGHDRRRRNRKAQRTVHVVGTSTGRAGPVLGMSIQCGVARPQRRGRAPGSGRLR